MANEIKTRIQLKYDSLKNWATANTLLLQGEVAIAYLPPKGTGTAPAATSEAVLIKVGPGNFNDLPYVSALAADVYAWAKQSENDFVTNFLALKTTDGTTMQAKLNAVFATDDELTAAINGLSQQVNTWLTDYYNKSEVDALIQGVKDEIPETDDFGVMSVTADANKASTSDLL